MFFVYCGGRIRQPKGLRKPSRNRDRSSRFYGAIEALLYDPGLLFEFTFVKMRGPNKSSFKKIPDSWGLGRRQIYSTERKPNLDLKAGIFH